MSKRSQSDYLASLLTEGQASQPGEATAPAPAPSGAQPMAPLPARPGTGMTLLARESALARVAAGEVKQVTQLLLDPARVRIWPGNARHQASLNAENCSDLIDSILAEGGQKVPALVRRVLDDPDHEYEAVIGTRRHFAVSWLRANNYPEMMFVAQAQNIDDETAFRLADLENRARRDISDFERARNYREALQAHYGGRQVRMAERLRVSAGWLSKMMTVAEIPEWAVAAFAGPTEIQLATCYRLAQQLSALEGQGKAGAATLKAIRTVAQQLAQQQDRLRQAGSPPLPAADVVKRLLSAGDPSGEADSLYACDSVHGRRAITVLSSNRNGVTIRLHAGSGADEEELATMMKAALGALTKSGRGLLK